jgi:hypothetical protein
MALSGLPNSSFSATSRPRRRPSAASGPVMSASTRERPREPSPAAACSCVSGKARLRTRLSITPGSPAPENRPAGPRRASTRSNSARSSDSWVAGLPLTVSPSSW